MFELANGMIESPDWVGVRTPYSNSINGGSPKWRGTDIWKSGVLRGASREAR